MLTASNDKTSAIYEEMFRAHFSSLCYFAQKYVSDFDSSKEIVHKVFVTIWEKRENFDFNKPAKSYLYTAVYNRCMNFIRDKKGKVTDNNLDLVDTLSSNIINTDHLEVAELESQIWKIIDTLPERCRAIFILNRFEGLKYSEIAGQLNISEKTVEAQMSKALSVLREGLKDHIYILIIFLIKYH